MSLRTDTGLPPDWVFSPSIDFELKQYTLLGYLQRVKARFNEQKLYPHLEQVQAQVNDLQQLRRTKQVWANGLNGELLGFDPTTGSAIHERPQDNEPLRVIDEVIDFAIPGLMRMQYEGVELREELVRRISLFPVGVQPLHVSEGWLLLRTGKQARVYGYSIPFLREQNEERRHHNLITRYVTTVTLGISSTYDRIKADLIQQHPGFPNPATFAVETDLTLPCIETYVPLAKWVAFAHLTGNAQ